MDLKRLKQLESLKAGIIEGAGATFLKGLERSLARLNARVQVYAQDLANGERMVSSAFNLARATQARVQIEEILLESGFREDTRRLVNAYDKLAEVNRTTLRELGIPAAFTEGDVTVLTAIKNMDLRRWEAFGGEIANTIQAQLVDAVVSGSSQAEFREAIEKTLIGIGQDDSRYVGRAKTLANTLTQSFDRAVTNNKAAVAGITTFIYLGPDDNLTRPFCQALLEGTGSGEFNIPEREGNPPIYTIDEIEEMQNGTALQPLTSGGGYNCRHSFRPISVQVAQEINA